MGNPEMEELMCRVDLELGSRKETAEKNGTPETLKVHEPRNFPFC